MTDPVSGSPAVTPEALDRAMRAFDDAACGGFDALRGEEWPYRAMEAALAAAHPEPMVPLSEVIRRGYGPAGVQAATAALRVELEKAQAENERLGEALRLIRGRFFPADPEKRKDWANQTFKIARAALDAHEGGRR